MHGRSTPGSRPMRKSADAIVAPVLPAETMALALPSRTSSAARTSDESFFLRTLAPGSSSIAITSVTATTGRPSGVAHEFGHADEGDVKSQLIDGALGARDDLSRSEVTTHRVNGDGQRQLS